MRFQLLPAAGAFLLAAMLAGQSGWKVVKRGFTPMPGMDVPAAANVCQISVPADWHTNALDPERQDAPRDSADFHASVRAVKPGISFKQEVQVVKDNDHQFSPSKQVVEDSSQRYWTTKPDSGSTQWDVLAPGKPGGPVCMARIEFKGAAQEAVARTIALSLGPAR